MKPELFDLTNPQKAIWLTEQFYKGQNINNVCGTLYIQKALNFEVLENAINLFVENNDSSRIRLHLQNDGTVKQYFSKYEPLELETVCINSEEDLTELREQITSKPFELFDSSLCSFTMFKFPNNYGGFIGNFHHTICDSWSGGICSNQVLDIYCKLLKEEEIIFDSSLSYKNYISAEQDYLCSPKFLKDKSYWEEIYSTVPENATIPASFASDINSLAAKRIEFSVPTHLLSKIHGYCNIHKVTPFNFYMTLLGIYVSRVSNLNDFVIGTPILNRTNKAEKKTAGMFINTIPFRITIDSKDTFSSFVSKIAVNSTSMLRHQKYSYQYIIDDIRQKVPGTPTLYNICFSYQITKMTDNEEEFPHSNIWTFTNNMYDDIDLHALEYDDSTNSKLSFMYDYKTSKYTEKDIKALHSRLLYIAEQIISTDNVLLKDIEIATEKEKQELLYTFNDNNIDIPPDVTLVSMFNNSVEQYSNNIAIVHNSSSITYKELDELSNRLAHLLIENGASQHDVIGVCLNRSIELMISLWAILKIGATYMPMYSKYPVDRLNYMVENSNCSMIITNSIIHENLNSNVKTVILNNYTEITCKNSSNLKCNSDENDLAYIIYTSGSTGKPKGVQITHRNLINFIYALNNSYQNINNEDSLLASTSISFDVSIFELFLSILNGAKLVLYNEEYITDIINYTNYIINNEITLLYIPPNILDDVYSLLKNSSCKINKLLVGVEGIKKSTLNKYFNLNPKMTIVNGYGPTETTICATTLLYKKDFSDDSYVSIGKPLANNNIYILNDSNKVQPIGVLGHLYVSGRGVGKGYINNPSENKSHFVPNIFDDTSEYMYKTGDLAKWNSDGTITFVGRKDTQIKLHGYRIELSEINNVLSQNPYITRSLVTIREVNSQKCLIAYFTSTGRLEVDNLDLYLKSKIPFYMIPNYYIQLDTFPLTTNGKIDIKKLPLPKETINPKYVAPSTDTERILCSIWSSLFGKDEISVTENFFSLGGDSLTAIKLQIEALKYDINISYSDIFHYPTIKMLSEKKLDATPEYEDFSDYNYAKINKLLSINTSSKIPKTRRKEETIPSNNLLLFGSTGFLGAHILDSFLSNSSGIAYCLVRNKGLQDAEERLRKTLNFYFDDKYNTSFKKRIRVIQGDIVQDKFGLTDSDYKHLSKSVNIVINSAAFVKHYGDFKLFDNINVLGTKHIIDFCKDFNKKLYHVSTISVSGTSTPEYYSIDDSNRIIFDETKFYINQSLNNAYIFTKFEAEKCIFEEMQNGLEACVLRIGNISNRYSDAKFQINTLDNAYINRLKSLLKLEVIPNEFLKHSLEFTPVDACADSIIKIVFSNPKFNVFHLFNTNLIPVPRLIELLNLLGYKLESVSKRKFSETLNQFLQDDTLKDSISGIIPDLDNKKNLNLISNVLPIADFTEKYLDTLGFKWPLIDIEYIQRYIEYFKNIGYLD